MPHCKCGEANPESFYYSNDTKCKECIKVQVRLNYRENIEHYVTYEKEREQRPERKESKFLYMRKHRSINPEKYRARTAVGNAIRDGRLFKKDCEICGDSNSQAHHEDYSKPLDVRWMCFTCHRAEHGQEARDCHYAPKQLEVRQQSLF